MNRDLIKHEYIGPNSVLVELYYDQNTDNFEIDVNGAHVWESDGFNDEDLANYQFDVAKAVALPASA